MLLLLNGSLDAESFGPFKELGDSFEEAQAPSLGGTEGIREGVSSQGVTTLRSNLFGMAWGGTELLSSRWEY